MNAIRVSSQRTNRWIRLSVVLAALVVAFWIGFIGLAQPRSDRVIKRNGSSVTGHLDSVDETNVTVNGHAIPRSEVKAILFAGTKTTAGPAQSSSNTSGTNLTDLGEKRV